MSRRDLWTELERSVLEGYRRRGWRIMRTRGHFEARLGNYGFSAMDVRGLLRGMELHEKACRRFRPGHAPEFAP